MKVNYFNSLDISTYNKTTYPKWNVGRGTKRECRLCHKDKENILPAYLTVWSSKAETVREKKEWAKWKTGNWKSFLRQESKNKYLNC